MSHTTVEEEKPLEVYRLESQPIIFPRIIDGIEKVRPGLANSHVIINKSVWTLDDLRNLLTATCDETFFIQDNRLEYLGDKELTLRIHIGEQTEILHFKNAGKPYYGEEMSPEFTLKALLITNPYPLEVFKITIGDDPANRHQGLHTTINNSNELCSLLALAFSRGKRFFKSNGTMWIWATGEPFSCTINDTIHLNFLPINS